KKDSGLVGKKGRFKAAAWSEAEKDENATRRGMIKASANGHAFEWADGTPFFLMGDTWWPVPTFRYRWYEDDKERPIGPEAGLKDYLRFRKKQGFNCIAMIAALPNWANDDKPRGLKTADGTVLRSAWKQAGTNSAKDMHDEDGNRAFLFPGKVPGFEEYYPDVERINPKYFQNMDKKIDYLNSQGFVPFIEVSRRDIGQAWKKYYDWPGSYTRYIQYIWSRYQANICLFSPIHLDWTGATIPASEWNEAANAVIDKYGHPPFGTMAGTNSNPSTLRNFGHVDKARWLTFHQIGNRRTHDLYPYLTEIYNATPPVPGINGEPYYAGMLDAEGGTEKSALYCRSAMYGSVLSGGLGGHIYGAGGWKGWEVIKWESAGQMQHLRDFVLSVGGRYQKLIPSPELVEPSRAGKEKSCLGWAYCARTAEKDLFLLYFEKDCPPAKLSGAIANETYTMTWFEPQTGRWYGNGVLTMDGSGVITLPRFPGGKGLSAIDWGVKLRLARD
ncbi:MAG: apiosidase-like domain-containing protein, partial [Planctomycetota bacterium]